MSRKRSVQDFQFGSRIGEGSYSSVYKAVDLKNRKVFAIKVLSKKHIVKEKKIKYVNIEKTTLNRLGRHPGIVTLYYTFQDENSLYFVIDLAEFGELLTIIRKLGSLSETCSRYYMIQLIDALDFMHKKGIIHRDLKPENILVNSDMKLMITDFGAAKILDIDSDGNAQIENVANKDASTTNDSENLALDSKGSFVGTAEYVSPELLKYNKCGYECDIWAIGCILYQFIIGIPPFKGKTEYLTFEKIVSLQYKWPNIFVHDDIKDLVNKLLRLEPSERLTIPEIQQHKWFGDFNWNDKSKIWNSHPPKLEPYKPNAYQQQRQHAQNTEQLKKIIIQKKAPTALAKKQLLNNTYNQIRSEAGGAYGGIGATNGKLIHSQPQALPSRNQQNTQQHTVQAYPQPPALKKGPQRRQMMTSESQNILKTQQPSHTLPPNHAYRQQSQAHVKLQSYPQAQQIQHYPRSHTGNPLERSTNQLPSQKNLKGTKPLMPGLSVQQPLYQNNNAAIAQPKTSSTSERSNGSAQSRIPNSSISPLPIKASQGASTTQSRSTINGATNNSNIPIAVQVRLSPNEVVIKLDFINKSELTYSKLMTSDPTSALSKLQKGSSLDDFSINEIITKNSKYLADSVKSVLLAITDFGNLYFFNLVTNKTERFQFCLKIDLTDKMFAMYDYEFDEEKDNGYLILEYLTIDKLIFLSPLAKKYRLQLRNSSNLSSNSELNWIESLLRIKELLKSNPKPASSKASISTNGASPVPTLRPQFSSQPSSHAPSQTPPPLPSQTTQPKKKSSVTNTRSSNGSSISIPSNYKKQSTVQLAKQSFTKKPSTTREVEQQNKKFAGGAAAAAFSASSKT